MSEKQNETTECDTQRHYQLSRVQPIQTESRSLVVSKPCAMCTGVE